MGTSLMLLAISGSGLLSLLIWLLVLAAIFYLVNWAIGYIGIGDPFAKIIRLVVGIIFLILLINALLGLIGKPFIEF